MFFLNHSTKIIIVDLPTISEPPALFAALKSSIGTFDKIVLIDSAGERETLSTFDVPEEIKDSLSVFPKEEEPFPVPGTLSIDFLQTGEVAPYECVYITETAEHLAAVHNHLAGTILFTQEVSRQDIAYGPDQIITRWSELPGILSGEVRGYLGEADVSAGTAIKLHPKPKGYMLRLKNDHLAQCPIYVGGRYLKAEDSGSKRHLYTRHLLHAKNKPEVHAKHFSHVIKGLIDYLARTEKMSAYRLTCVPPRPGEPDRMKELLSGLGTRGEKVETLLTCTRYYPKQKRMRTLGERAANVRGAFGVADNTIAGQNVIVIDDIGVTFSTMNECARALLIAGARKVALLAIAFSTWPSEAQLIDLQCEKCEAPLRLMFNSRTGDPFWACSNYSAYAAGERDHTTKRLVPGFRELRAAEENLFSPGVVEF